MEEIGTKYATANTFAHKACRRDNEFVGSKKQSADLPNCRLKYDMPNRLLFSR
jgi:hypothetical protein